jgi:hypothetical protein
VWDNSTDELTDERELFVELLEELDPGGTQGEFVQLLVPEPGIIVQVLAIHCV